MSVDISEITGEKFIFSFYDNSQRYYVGNEGGIGLYGNPDKSHAIQITMNTFGRVNPKCAIKMSFMPPKGQAGGSSNVGDGSTGLIGGVPEPMVLFPCNVAEYGDGYSMNFRCGDKLTSRVLNGSDGLYLAVCDLSLSFYLEPVN